MATGDNPGNGTWNHNVSIYTPPYLYKGARPAITSIDSTQWDYRDMRQITVNTPIVKAELIRPAAVTHSSDPNQRSVDLPLTVDGDNIGLNVTSNPNLAPPGWYMLFVVDANGVPSVATWVHLGGSGGGGGSPMHAMDAMEGMAAPMASMAMGDDADPTPLVHDFADDLTERPAQQQPATRAPVSTKIAGCDRSYGSVGVCVPIEFPDTVAPAATARCDWLREHEYALPLARNGDADPLGLDPNGDGQACGPGDA
jgi:hypothetical protein